MYACRSSLFSSHIPTRLDIYVARQANDLLRDQLTDMSSQLCEERDRVRELEGIRVTDAALLKRSTDNLLHAGMVSYLSNLIYTFIYVLLP